MARWLVERRLIGVGTRLRTLREELRVVEEQLVQIAGEADDAQTRALVAESPLAGREHRDARRHAEVFGARRAQLRRSISELEARQDRLLDQLSA